VTKKRYSRPAVTSVTTPPQVELCSTSKPFDCDVNAGGGICPGVCGASISECNIICPPF
jgi:hypothetical protein